MSTHSSFTISEITELLNLVASVGGMSEVRQLLRRGVIPFTTIRAQTDHFESIARAQGMTNISIGGDIFTYLPDAIAGGDKAPRGTFTPVDTVSGTKESDMQETAQKMSLSQAIQYYTDELEAGTFDTDTYRIIFLTDVRASDGKELGLPCFRSSGGLLHLGVGEVIPGNAWVVAGSAWLATNP
jgi:hypothetical protein